MPTPYGQFGTPGYFSQDIPTDIIKQYPGTQNIKQAGQMFGNLLYGPLSNAYQVTSAQATDPVGQSFEQQMGGIGPVGPGGSAQGSGGAFAAPGEGSQALGQLFSGQMAGNVKGLAAKQAQQSQAAKGMLDTANAYAGDIYGTQDAANQLALAKAQQQRQEQQGIMQLVNLFTSPTSDLSNILGPGGVNALNPGQSALGGIWSSLFGGAGAAGGAGFLGGSGLEATGLGDLAASGTALGGTDITSIFESLAQFAPELAAYAA